MSKFHDDISGYTFRDKVSGHTGVATGWSEFITGCEQVLLCPKSPDPTKTPDGTWYDLTRLEKLDEVERVVLSNHNEAKAPAPKKGPDTSNDRRY